MHKEIKKFKTVKRANTNYYTKVNALKLIEVLRRNSLELYGYDGFEVFGKNIRIDQEYSDDFSAGYYDVKDCSDPKVYEMAKAHIQSLPDDLLFDMVFEEGVL